MITCVKKLSITGVRVLSFLVNSFEKLFLSQDTFFKITILIFSLVLSNLFFDLQPTYALKPTPTLSVSLLSNSNIELHSSDILSKPNHAVSIPNYLNIKTNNTTGTTTFIDIEKTTFTDVSDSSNTATINMIPNGQEKEYLADIGENTFAGSNDCEIDHPEREPKNWGALDLSSGSVHETNYGISIGDEVSGFNMCFAIGVKLGNNLPTGTYQNKVIFSTVTNEYPTEVNLIKGEDFRVAVWRLSPTRDIKHFERSLVAPPEGVNTVHLEVDETSDYPFLGWVDEATETFYYYSEAEKIYLNPDCKSMFASVDYEKIDLTPFDSSKVTSTYDMFSNLYGTKEIDFSKFNTSNVTNMGRMFYKNSTPKLDLSNFDTRNVIYMNAMFMEAWGIEELNLSSFDTSNVWFMGNMFKNTHKLKNLDVHHFNTQKVKHMQYMFYGSGATSLDLSHFDTSKVEDMSKMFAEMANITELDLSNFDTSNVKDMSRMFDHTAELRTLDLSNFNTSKVTDFSKMFANEYINKLERIYVKQDFDTSAGTDFTNIFTGRTNLRGGNGSFLPDPSTADKTWLRIDDPANGHPGYFTRKV